jgi:hypothetical protein
VQNRSRSDSLKIDENIKVKYSEYDRIIPITLEITHMMRNHVNISKKKSPIAYLSVINNNLIIRVKALTTTSSNMRFNLIKQDILLNVVKIIQKYDVEIIYW